MKRSTKKTNYSKGKRRDGWRKAAISVFACVFLASGITATYLATAESVSGMFPDGTSSADAGTTTDEGKITSTEKKLSVNRVANISNMEINTENAIVSNENTSVIGREYDDDDTITAIVRLNGQSLLDKATYGYNMSVQDFVCTKEGEEYVAALEKERDDFIAAHSSAIISVGYEYDVAFNGFSAQIKYKDLKKIEKANGVQYALVSESYLKPEAVTENNVNVYSTGIYDSSSVDYDGTGTVVAILDTGLDYTHSAFQNMPTGTLAMTKDDVEKVFDKLAAKKKNEENSNNVQALRVEDLYLSEKVPYAYDYADDDPDVYPVNDHGTHVAGIIAGKDDTITGVATQAQLAIFKTFGNEDAGAPQDALLAALQDAILLGVDAINMSLGSSCGFARATDEDNTAEIYDSIKAAGICLLVAASNSYSSAQGSTHGDTNLASNPDSMTVGSPATYDASMAVASISGVKTSYLVADGEKAIYFENGSLLNGKKEDFVAQLLGDAEEKTFEYVVVPGIGEIGNYANVDVKGKIAVIRRGSNTFEDKIRIAQIKGAVAAIIYNNVSGTISMSVGKVTLPACSVQMDAGEYLKDKKSGTLVLSKNYLAGPFMSGFSSWGPKADLELCPDITAHGGDIYSSVRGGYDTYSGTSMACPNMAGATILVRQYVKEKYAELSAYDVTEMTYRLMMSTTTIARNEDGNPYSPRKQGAGLADIEKAIDTNAYLYVEGQNKTKLNLYDDPEKTGVYEMKFHIKNISSSAVSYRINPIVMTESMSSDKMTVAEKAYMFDDTSFTASAVNGKVKNGVVTVQGYEDCTLTVIVTLSDKDKAYLDETFANGMYVEGFVELQSLNEDGISLNIPYLAFYGDWTQAPMLDVTAYEVGESQEDSSVLEKDKLKPDVYASVGMGGFNTSEKDEDGKYKETYYYMGGFCYILADGYTAPATIEDKSSLSCDTDATYSLYAISAGLLRNAKKVYMTITDAETGEVVFSKETENARKSYSNGGSQTGGYVEVKFYANEYNLENNRKYTFSMECELDYYRHEQKNLKNTFSFSFYIDNEAPVMDESATSLKEVKDETGRVTRRTLTMNVYDNHYLQGYFVYTCDGEDGNGGYLNREQLFKGCVPVDGERNSTNVITLDVTNRYNELLEAAKNGKKLLITFADYAKNMSSYMIDLSRDTAQEATDVRLKSSVEVNEEGRPALTLQQFNQQNLYSMLDVYPLDMQIKEGELTWTSSDPAKVTVLDGLVTAKDITSAPVLVTVADKHGHEVSFEINVKENKNKTEITLSDLVLSTNAVSLERGEERWLTVDIKPYNIDESVTLEWSKSNTYFKVEPDPENQCRVKITALKSGRGTLKVQAAGKKIGDSCTVVVKEEFTTEGRYLRSYTGRGDENGVVEIPDDLGITHIYQYAFLGNKYITKIILPEGVEEIGVAAIYGCDNLEEVVLPSTMKKIDKWGMGWNPKLKKVNAGAALTIGDYAFYRDPMLSELDLTGEASAEANPGKTYTGTHFIGAYTFMGANSLTSLDLSTVVHADRYAFARCENLADVTLGKDTKIAAYAFTGCNSLTKVTINSSIVGALAFMNCSSLNTVVFNEPVDAIDYGAFYNCTALREVVFNSTVRVIGERAFYGCTALTSFRIPDGVEELGAFAFAGCTSLRYVIFARDAVVSTVNALPFYGCTNLSTFLVEDGAKYLSVGGYRNGNSYYYVLFDKGMTTLKLVPTAVSFGISMPDTVTKIGDYAVAGTNVTAIGFNNVTEIGNGAFYGCAALQAKIGSKVEKIGDRAYALIGSSSSSSVGVALTDLPSTLKYIGEEAFYGSRILSSNVTLPDSVEYVGDGAFYGIQGVTAFTWNGSLKEIPDSAFAASRITTVNLGGATAIGANAFEACANLTTVNGWNTVETIGEGAFKGCAALTSATLPENLKKIEKEAFASCTALTSVTIPEGLEEIGENAFAGCTKLTAFDFKNVEKIGNGAFENTALTSVSTKATAIGENAFAGCTGLTAFTADQLKEIGNGAFGGNTKLSSLALPAIETIGNYAFENCAALKAIDFGTVKSIGDYAFAGCSALASVNLGSAVNIGDSAFAGTAISEISLNKDIALRDSDVRATGGLHPTAFKNANALEKISVDVENKTLFTEIKNGENDGVLYSKLTVKNGRINAGYYYDLVAYPAAKAGTEYTVRDYTLRIRKYAFYNAAALEKATLPATVVSIGASAFENCENLKTLTFGSAQAPVLEGEYDDLAELYDASSAYSYRNFVTVLAEAKGNLIAEVPANAVGYDTYVWKAYFAEVNKSDSVAVTKNTLYVIDLIRSVENPVTAEDKVAVALCRKLLDSLIPAQRALVPEDAVKILEQAEKDAKNIRTDNASSSVTPLPATPASSESKNTSTAENKTSGEEKKGCSGSVVSGALAAATALLAVVFVASKRRAK